MSDLKKEGYANGTLKINKDGAYKGIEERNRRWEENPQLKVDMRKKVSEHHNLYQYLKIDKVTKEILETFENRLELLENILSIKQSLCYLFAMVGNLLIKGLFGDTGIEKQMRL